MVQKIILWSFVLLFLGELTFTHDELAALFTIAVEEKEITGVRNITTYH